MKNTIYGLLTILMMMSCESDTNVNPYLISKNSVGKLTDSTSLRQLVTLFDNDSVVSSKSNPFLSNSGELEIYNSEGKKMLALTPSKVGDSSAVIKSVQIFDPNYRTGKGISVESTFKEINDNYSISSISNLINSIVISVNEINASFTIDKQQLPPNLRYDMQMNIEKAQIPDDAKVKFFMLHWDAY